MDRREFLKTGSASMTLASMGGMATALSAIQAQVADKSGYKALVCVFLFGGMDNYDTLFRMTTHRTNTGRKFGPLW